jgi:hypothetical protein
MKIAQKPVIALFALLLLVSSAYAHETKVVGPEGNGYRVIVGMVREPVFTDERNGLDLIIRRDDDEEPVEGLAESLNAEFTAPGGEIRELTLRAQWGRPGYYTDDILLTQPGVYQIHIWGFIGEVEFDETFETHEVRPLTDLRFP